MHSTRSLCLFVVLIAYVAAEKGKCAKEHNIDQPDFEELKKNPIDPPEKMLCFFKCEYERVGALNADKTVDADKLVEELVKWRRLRETAKNEIKECVQKLTVPVNSCPDVKPYHLCVHNVLKNEV
ncbi:uncharacterized protein LOC123318953 isoform X2 [Coccinella septempunctata]|uniref:uncharacterized protein LOC123318953 isoform X2 n=1 Tax=Coccinella septempunctata TaxID=41139 RepID=UPI001D08D94F|nr:uncharacterized protein LOC123318953 isoform X2 [Coccinella septempunctata]